MGSSYSPVDSWSLFGFYLKVMLTGLDNKMADYVNPRMKTLLNVVYQIILPV